MRHHHPNRWRGFVLGLAGGVAGTVAMGGYWRAVTALTGDDPRAWTREAEPQPLDSISLIGTQAEAGESSTAAIGRIAYEQLAGRPPESDETKSTLSYLVHYGYGAGQGGVYGALTAGGDRTAGLGYGTAMWLFGDEGAVSLLGLAEGPTRYPVKQHLHRWAAHLTYGVVLWATTTALKKVV